MGCASSATKAILTQSMGELPPGVVRLRAEDEDKAVDLWARCWAGDGDSEPQQASALFEWLLGPHLQNNFADPLRLEMLQWVCRYFYRDMIRGQGFILGAKNPANRNELLAVCMACPRFIDSWVEQAADKMAAYTGPMKAIMDVGHAPCSREPVRSNIGKGIEKRLYSLWKLRELPAKVQVGEHLWVSCLACKPSTKGQNEKVKLLQAVTMIADNMELPCYMESAQKEDFPFYRKFCFSEHGPFEIGPSHNYDDVEPFKELFALVRPTTRL